MSIKRDNFRLNAAARARRLRELARQPAPTKAEIEVALALVGPLGENPYQRLLRKIDLDRLARAQRISR